MYVCVMMMMVVVVMGDDVDGDRQMGGRDIVRNCPVARMAAILASTSCFLEALKRGPSGILFIGLSLNKNGTIERRLASLITGPCD